MRCEAAQVFDHKDSLVVESVTNAALASQFEFVGIFDAISTPETYACEAKRWPPRLRAPSSCRQCALERQDRYDLRRHRRCNARLPGFPDARAAERKARVSCAANHCRQGLRAYQQCAEEVKGRCECDEADDGIVGRWIEWSLYSWSRTYIKR